MEASGYTGGVGNVGYFTSTGHRVRKGVVAVDPNVIKLGTKLYVKGYGHAQALDVGSAIKGNKIDLYFETYQEAIKWGRRKVKVFILKD
jgi:3D (Asp-Asp-Asp) domain-containing protein